MRNAAPAKMKADAVAPDPFDRQSEPVADTFHDQSFYSADFLNLLREQARPCRRIRAVPPIGPHLSDDARHAPTLAAGAVACLLAAGTATAFWLALVAGMAPLDGKSGLPGIEIAQTPEAIADENPQAGARGALPAGIAPLSGYRDALSTGRALQAWLDATLLLAHSSTQPWFMTAARPTTPPVTRLATPELENETLPTEHEAEPSPIVVPSSDLQLSSVPEMADQPPAFPAPAQVRAQPRDHRGGNDNGKQERPTLMPLSFTTASRAAPADDSSAARDIAPAPTAQNVTEASPPGEDSSAAEPGASGVSPSNRAKSSAARTDGQGADASGSDAPAKRNDAIGDKKEPAGSGTESPGSAGGSERSDQNGRSKGGKSDGDRGESNRGNGDKGKGDGDQGKGDGAKDSKDKGKSDRGKDNNGKGDKGKGDRDKGGKGKGGKGSR